MGNPRQQKFARSRGIALIYCVVAMTAMMGMISLAVDMGEVQFAKTTAQAAADAAALYAAEGIVGGTAASVRARAVAAAADNKMNGASIVVDPTQDIVFGIWDSSAHILIPVASGAESSATAIQVTVHFSKSRGTAISLPFAALIGVSSADVVRSAVASIGQVTTASVPGMASPWLAGMPTGSSIPNTGGNPVPVYAPASSPVGFTVAGGDTLRFASAGGTTTWNPGAGTGAAGCDGDATYIAAQDSVNGINTTYAPLNAMMGIFLTDDQPSWTSPAATLDFSTAASRNFSTLSPGLKQAFFIGDGLDASGNLQTFKAPAGATRLFVGTMDEKGWWWDNLGALTFTAVDGNDASLVR